MKSISTTEDKKHTPRSHLFTLRLWPEVLGNGEVEWRGKVQYVLNREVRYFRDWPELIQCLLELQAGPSPHQDMEDG